MSTQCPRCKVGQEVLRTNARTGTKFWGCSNYPECNKTRPVSSWDDMQWGLFISAPNLKEKKV